MDQFGVVSANLKKVANHVVIPLLMSSTVNKQPVYEFMGAMVKNLSTLDERSATGMASETGVLVLEVAENSPLKPYIKPNDVILRVNNKAISKFTDLEAGYKGSLAITIFRDQKEQNIKAEIK